MQSRPYLEMICVIVTAVVLSACASTGQQTESAGTTTADPSYLSEEESERGRLVLEIVQPTDPGEDFDPHYAFAHIVLPRAVFQNAPKHVREQFLETSPDNYLQTQWKALGGSQDGELPTAEEVQLADGSTGVLIDMPEPRRDAHAYYTLIVFKGGGEFLYFTLESSTFLGDEDGTVVGGWRIDEKGASHLNYGEDPGPGRDAFLRSVGEILTD